MSLRAATETAIAGREVGASELEAAFGEIMDGAASPVAIAALLVALRTKGETYGEIAAAARALRARAETAVAVDPCTVDTCGTGGGGANTFNISTTAAFVVAGAGVPVAKHGNRAASSQSGSFDVLEALGVRIDLPIDACAEILAGIGIAPFFARTAHPAMRYVAPVRQQLGLRTIMNCIGPLLNPVAARHQLVGVYDAALIEPLARALDRAGIVCNYNSVPHDKRKPFDPSGIRLGTPAVTTRGFAEDDMRWVADRIAAVTDRWEDEDFLERTAADVREHCAGFPAPGIRA